MRALERSPNVSMGILCVVYMRIYRHTQPVHHQDIPHTAARVRKGSGFGFRHQGFAVGNEEAGLTDPGSGLGFRVDGPTQRDVHAWWTPLLLHDVMC